MICRECPEPKAKILGDQVRPRWRANVLTLLAGGAVVGATVVLCELVLRVIRILEGQP